MLEERELYKQCMHAAMQNLKKDMIRDPNDPDYGFTRVSLGQEIGAAHFHCAFAAAMVAFYCTEGTDSYHDQELLELAKCSLEHSLRFMYEDGTMDLAETNMHDPTYVAFDVRDYLGPVLELMTRFSTHTPMEDEIYEMLTSSLRTMAEGMKHLGFHTPNHRWIICSALSFIYKFMGDEEALEVIQRFLMEGIDIDENGEYTERSAGMYNEVCNRSFLMLYHLWKDPKYLDCVVRNMRLTDSYVEPDGTICTMNSMRQDVGYHVKRDVYGIIYMPLALFSKDPEFAYWADWVYQMTVDSCQKAGGPVPGWYIHRLYWFKVEEDFYDLQFQIEPKKPDGHRNLYLPKSGMVREYNGNTTLSLSCGKTPDFLKFQVGSSPMFVRGGCSFFGQPHAQFRPHTIEKTEKGYRLIAHEEAGYRSQLDEPPATSEWRLMDHSKRKIINRQYLDIVVDVNPTADGFELEANATCTGRVPFKLEFQFVPNLLFTSETFSFFGKADDYIYYKSGNVYVHFDDKTIYEISGGSADYLYADTMRGTEHVRGGSFTLCMDAHTPATLHFSMRKVDVKEDPSKIPYRC